MELPARPRLSMTTVRRKSDGRQQMVRLLNTTVSDVFYTIHSFENPEPMQSLEEFVEELGLGSAVDPASKRILVVDGVAGIEYSSANKSLPIVVQYFATENHLYRFVAMGREGGRASVEQFFSSLKLGKNLEGTAVSESGQTPIDSDVGDIYSGRDVDVKARLLAKPEARYTADARKYEISGVVVLKVLFARNGTVVNISVISGLPYGLTEQAIAAARKIKFIPAMKEGRPVSMWMQLEYRFNNP